MLPVAKLICHVFRDSGSYQSCLNAQNRLMWYFQWNKCLMIIHEFFSTPREVFHKTTQKWKQWPSTTHARLLVNGDWCAWLLLIQSVEFTDRTNFRRPNGMETILSSSDRNYVNDSSLHNFAEKTGKLVLTELCFRCSPQLTEALLASEIKLRTGSVGKVHCNILISISSDSCVPKKLICCRLNF